MGQAYILAHGLNRAEEEWQRWRLNQPPPLQSGDRAEEDIDTFVFTLNHTVALQTKINIANLASASCSLLSLCGQERKMLCSPKGGRGNRAYVQGYQRRATYGGCRY
ncbi:hypothetical protein NQZ68_032704 [Dissostichus eleginoides]|nr:hypothetical protein NQZ68_032704 [Dissostichus eleginoides]